MSNDLITWVEGYVKNVHPYGALFSFRLSELPDAVLHNYTAFCYLHYECKIANYLNQNDKPLKDAFEEFLRKNDSCYRNTVEKVKMRVMKRPSTVNNKFLYEVQELRLVAESNVQRTEHPQIEPLGNTTSIVPTKYPNQICLF